MQIATREQAYEAIKTLNGEISKLKCADLLNNAKYGHEVDVGYGKVETVADTIKILARMVHFLRHEARAVNVNDGMYDFCIKNCDRASILVGQIELIEGRTGE